MCPVAVQIIAVGTDGDSVLLHGLQLTVAVVVVGRDKSGFILYTLHDGLYPPEIVIGVAYVKQLVDALTVGQMLQLTKEKGFLAPL